MWLEGRRRDENSGGGGNGAGKREMGRASTPLSKAMAYKPTVDPVTLHGLFIFLIGLERNNGKSSQAHLKLSQLLCPPVVH